MFEKLDIRLTPEQREKKLEQIQKLKSRYVEYKDPWGFNIETIEKALDLIYPLYLNYFKVRVFGTENIKDRPYIFVSNHTGQIPIDGVLITTAVAMEQENPRVLHSMVDHFLAGFPFLGDLSAQTGSILGDRENCNWLIEQGESILVFPEGMKGITKNTTEFYNMKKFTNGFYRIALKNKIPIIPVTVVGAEEMFPFVFHAKTLAKKLGLPTLPLTLNSVPLPSPIDIYFGKPIEVNQDLDLDAPDAEIRKEIYNIEKSVKTQLKVGLDNRRPFFDSVRKPIRNIMEKLK